MSLCVFVLLYFTISPAVSAVAEDNPCSANEYLCGIICLDRRRICNGKKDCPFGIDEKYCYPMDSDTKSPSDLSRFERVPLQVYCPLYDGWLCHDGKTCITQRNKCDGIEDCLDSSDEALSLCSNTTSSPEPDVESTSTELAVGSQQPSDPPPKLCLELDLDWPCEDGTCISYYQKCDGKVDCPDSSDETLSLCINTTCRSDWFQCTYGACVIHTAPCDGIDDCVDKSDELLPKCTSSSTGSSLQLDVKSTSTTELAVRNQLSDDPPEELCPDSNLNWPCEDGTCISEHKTCDGTADCPDSSDETSSLCINHECWLRWFQCTYGACVPSKTLCDGIDDCVDKSDELLSNCRSRVGDCLLPPYPEKGKYIVSNPERADSRSLQLNVTCDPGYDVTGNNIVDCKQGYWSHIIPDCVRPCKLDKNPSIHYYCLDYAKSGGQRDCETFEHSGIIVRAECKSSNSVVSVPYMRCINGSWDNISVCNPIITNRGTNMDRIGFCKLDSHPSVHYYCLVYGDIEGQRACKTYEPSGTIVRPECNSPNYDSTIALPNMRCIDGNWNYIAICNPECGRVTPESSGLIIDGWEAQRGELPWHVGIYRKTTRPFMQICGGSLVTNSVVISAAHCFWNDVTKQQPASKYAVAIGKLYQGWDHDEEAQKSDVKDIKIPPRFRGGEANFQEDIAVVILETPFVYRTYVRPVCLNFNIYFDRRQLQPGNLGKVAGWGLTAANGNASDILKVVDLPYVDIVKCISNTPVQYRETITGDKICAGYTNGTALCRGDSGGGLAFPESERGTDRYYLRGIVSTAPRVESLCNAHALTAFTHLSRHEHFVKKYL